MKRGRGFTLLEVLVSSVILFATIATVTAVFSSTFRSSQTATSYVKSSVYAVYIYEHIAAEVRLGKLVGNGHWDGVDFSWSSKEKSTGMIDPSLAGETNSGNQDNRRIRLLDVNVSLSNENKILESKIEVVTWE